MQVTTLLRAQVAFAARGAVDGARTWGDRLQHRLDDLERGIVAADHQAVPALESENPAAGADVDVMDALLAERFGPPDVITVIRVATVDDDVALVEQPGQLLNGLPGQPRRDHHPGHPRLGELPDELLQRGRADGPLGLELLDRVREYVVHDAVVAVPHQAPHDVGAHPAKSDHSQLHGASLPLPAAARGGGDPGDCQDRWSYRCSTDCWPASVVFSRWCDGPPPAERLRAVLISGT